MARAWSLAARAFAQEGNLSGQGLSLFYRGVVEYRSGRHTEALETFRTSLALYERLERPDGVALVRLQVGNLSAGAALPDGWQRQGGGIGYGDPGPRTGAIDPLRARRTGCRRRS